VNQTRLESLIEVCVNVAIGWVLAIITQLIIFPLFGIHIGFGDQILISIVFTVISIGKGYVIRRWFNGRIRGISHKIATRIA
jgi:hypothetical protein